MVLHAEHRLRLVPQALRPCRRTGSGASPRRRRAATSGSTAKPWFCDVISILPVVELLHRMVRAAVAELQLERRPAHREAENLVAEADAEHRHVRRRRAPSRCRSRRSAAPDRRGRCSGTRRRASSPAARPPASSPDTRARRSRARSAGAGCSTSCRSRTRRSSAAASRGASGVMPNSSGSSCGQSNASSDVTPRTRSEPSIFGIAPRALDERLSDRAASPVAMTPRITPPDRSCRVSARVSMSEMATMLVGDEVVAQRALRAPVARHRRLLAHDEAGHLRRARLDVLGRHAVVADLRARHRDDLSGVGRIGQHFLIAGHARVEHDLAARLAFRAGGERRGTSVPSSSARIASMLITLSPPSRRCTAMQNMTVVHSRCPRSRSPIVYRLQRRRRPGSVRPRRRGRTTTSGGSRRARGESRASPAAHRRQRQRRRADQLAVEEHARAGRPRLDGERAGRRRRRRGAGGAGAGARRDGARRRRLRRPRRA